MSAAKLLDRLQRVRQTGPSRWIASCSAHEDRSPSLSVRELEDGTVLIKCFAGCGAADVVMAAGLQFADLFPEKVGDCRRPSRSTVPSSDVLKLLAHEVGVAWFLITDCIDKKSVTEESWQRLSDAARRIKAAEAHCRGR